MIITSKTIEWKEKIPTGLIKGWVVKWQRAFVTPFRDAAALEVVPVHLVLKLFTRKNNMTWPRHIHIKKGNNINTVSLLFKHYWWYKSPRNDSFQSESPCKPAKNSQTCLKTPHILF